MIVPLALWRGELLCRSWGCDPRPYTVPPSRTIACIGVADDAHSVRAIALLERIDKRVFVWNITAGDFESGTRLVHALTRQPEDVVVFTSTLHPRWRIACRYFRS